MAEIVFGTDGWRDVIADGFTVARVRRAVHGYAEHLAQARRGGEVLVGHDTRFGGARFARAAAEVLQAAGFTPLVHATPLPTPVLSFAVAHRSARGGVMLTASHNPSEYHGVKLKEAYGGTASEATYADVARRANAVTDDEVVYTAAAAFDAFDVREAYYGRLAGLLDLPAVRAWDGTLVHDAMHGAASGWIHGFGRWAGLRCRFETLRAAPDPTFGGANPEPIPSNLAALTERLDDEPPERALGVATDGDGDRLGVVAAGTGPLTSHQVLALLLDHLQARGARGRVVKTFTVSRVIERLARARGLTVVETPVGFKHLVAELVKGDVLIAGEESGGYGVSGHVPERDGILMALLTLEALTAGEALDVRFRALEREAGWRHAYDRRDVPLAGADHVHAVRSALRDVPETFAGAAVAGVERLDGVKLNLAGDRWVLFRASGTEPLLRLYCEAPDAAAVAATLDAAERFVHEHSA